MSDGEIAKLEALNKIRDGIIRDLVTKRYLTTELDFLIPNLIKLDDYISHLESRGESGKSTSPLNKYLITDFIKYGDLPRRCEALLDIGLTTLADIDEVANDPELHKKYRNIPKIGWATYDRINKVIKWAKEQEGLKDDI